MQEGEASQEKQALGNKEERNLKLRTGLCVGRVLEHANKNHLHVAA